MAQDDKPAKLHYHGHRERLRGKLLAQGTASLSDQEVIEFLLYGAIRRGDVKPLVKDLMARFGGLAGVLSADPEALMAVPGMGEASAAALKIAQEAATRLARAELREQPVISSWNRLLDYCRITMGHEPIEQFRLLFLDKKNQVIADERQQQGTVDHTPVYPREVVKRALELGASALILVHNHPSGDATPSRADIAMTKEIQQAAETLQIRLHDHIIIARGEHASFRALGLL